MQITPLNSNHVAQQIRSQEASLKSVGQTSSVEGLSEENILFSDPSRVEKVFNTLTRELSEREKDEREVALYKSMNPDYLQQEIPLYESNVVKTKIQEEKALLAKEEALKSEKIDKNEKTDKKEEESKAEEEFSQNNDAINSQNRLELNRFVDDFFTLFNSGYTPIDLKI